MLPGRTWCGVRNLKGRMLEIRLAGVHVLGTAVAYGQAAEAESIDDICFGDTQTSRRILFAGLCLTAAHTDPPSADGGCGQSAQPCSRRHHRRDCHGPVGCGIKSGSKKHKAYPG